MKNEKKEIIIVIGLALIPFRSARAAFKFH